MNDVERLLAEANGTIDAMYSDMVVALIRKKYSQNDELALLRQRDSRHDEFAAYDSYAEECKRIADLGVTMLAAGIGNIHGKYPANWPGLRFDVLAAISEKVGAMPLVLHGGTGIPADMIKKAISLGVSKINVNTECQLAFQAATRQYIEEGKDLVGKGFDPRKLLAPGVEAIKATVREKIALFGSANKA